MSLVWNRRGLGDSNTELIPPRVGINRTGTQNVTGDTALRHSAVWACLRLRADLISTLPVDVFRRVNGVQVEAPTPGPLLKTPSPGTPITEWLYSTQMDLDRYGNTFGYIAARDSLGFPAQIDLWSASDVTVVVKGGRITAYKYAGAMFSPDEVWHEKQYTVAGIPVGLSPIAYGAWSIGGYLSAQQFALDWFASSAAPAGTLRNTQQSMLDPQVLEAAKMRFKAATSNRDLFVTGADWEYTPGTVDAQGAAFLEQMRYGSADVCRYFGVPADMIDASSGNGSSITYANVTQRNLQLLVVNLGPAIVRREVALTAALPNPRYVKFNTDALLRMDPTARGEAILARVAGKTLAPSEARELDNLPPFTPEQEAEFARLLPAKATPTNGKPA